MSVYEDFTSFSKFADLGRWHITQFVKNVAEQVPIGAVVLDAGAGECVYKRFFAHARYVSVDCAIGEPTWNYHNLDCLSVLEKLPFADGSFDMVLSTQTLEHLEWPAESLQEIHRVLKPLGQLFLTAPMAHAEHQVPYDFFRYTSFGLRSLCQRAGFAEITIKPFGGLFMRWAYELSYVIALFPNSGLFHGKPHLWGIMLFPFKLLTLGLIRLLQPVLLSLDHFDRRKEFPFGWSLVAVKSINHVQ